MAEHPPPLAGAALEGLFLDCRLGPGIQKQLKTGHGALQSAGRHVAGRSGEANQKVDKQEVVVNKWARSWACVVTEECIPNGNKHIPVFEALSDKSQPLMFGGGVKALCIRGRSILTTHLLNYAA